MAKKAPSTMTNVDNNNNNHHAILFSRQSADILENNHRILSNNIGVRRVRPSDKQILGILKNEIRNNKQQRLQKNQDTSNDTLRVNSVGVASSSSTILDRIINNSHLDTDNDSKHEITSEITSSVDNDHNKRSYFQMVTDTRIIQEEVSELLGGKSSSGPFMISHTMTSQAFHLGILSSLKHDSSIFEQNHLNSMDQSTYSNHQQNTNAILDDCLSLQWSKVLKNSMKEAEEYRDNEQNIRPMAYQLIPEVWCRLRPSLFQKERNENDCDCDKVSNNIVLDESKQQQQQNNEGQYETSCNIENKNKSPDDFNATLQNKNSIIESNIIIQPQTRSRNIDNEISCQINRYDEHASIVYKLLHDSFPLIQISCGAKFGCDYLLYDGSRHERHAFAGLRILVNAKHNDHGKLSDSKPSCADTNLTRTNHDGCNDTTPFFPLLSAYDLAGYVRVLNTAGKLALIACVINEEEEEKSISNDISISTTTPIKAPNRVAIVDLALEKIISAPTHQRKMKFMKLSKSKDINNDISNNAGNRKTVGLHLDKRQN